MKDNSFIIPIDTKLQEKACGGGAFLAPEIYIDWTVWIPDAAVVVVVKELLRAFLAGGWGLSSLVLSLIAGFNISIKLVMCWGVLSPFPIHCSNTRWYK